MEKFFRYWAPLCGYAGLIFYLSAQSHPEEDLPSFIDLFNDKVLHAVEYALLGGLAFRAFRWGTSGSWRDRAVPLAVLLAALYGVSDELHQWFVPFREASWQDWLADLIGATFGAVMLARLPSLWPSSSAFDMERRS